MKLPWSPRHQHAKQNGYFNKIVTLILFGKKMKEQIICNTLYNLMTCKWWSLPLSQFHLARAIRMPRVYEHYNFWFSGYGKALRDLHYPPEVPSFQPILLNAERSGWRPCIWQEERFSQIELVSLPFFPDKLSLIMFQQPFVFQAPTWSRHLTPKSQGKLSLNEVLLVKLKWSYSKIWEMLWYRNYPFLEYKTWIRDVTFL